ncbi:MAG: hypothetical protein LBC88_00135 [Spirochaetaceae bacterium]|jgi:hypothetical protein|nr:hypothetical protein [Spirochaetaceae bacterium]
MNQEAVDLFKNAVAAAITGGAEDGHGMMIIPWHDWEELPARADIDAAFSAFPPAATGSITALRLGFADRIAGKVDLLAALIERLPGLVQLNLSHTLCARLPDNIGTLSNLRRLELQGTGIRELPRAVTSLAALEVLKAGGTPLRALPRKTGNLARLRLLDFSGSPVEKLPASITKCRLLAVRQTKGIALVHLIKHTVRRLAEIFFFVSGFQKWLYSYCYRKLGRLQKKANPCSWHEEAGTARCRRGQNHCCTAGGHCPHLEHGGCGVESLSCRLWLCGTALEYLAAARNDPRRPALRRAARRYLRARDTFEFLCFLFDLPLKGRSGKSRDFTPGEGELLNIYLDRWHDNILLRYFGNFISAADAAAERKRPE